MPGAAEQYIKARRVLLNVYRLLNAIPTSSFVQGFAALRADPRSADVAAQGKIYLADLFSAETCAGTVMVGRAVSLLDDPILVEAACVALTQDLLQAIS